MTGKQKLKGNNHVRKTGAALRDYIETGNVDKEVDEVTRLTAKKILEEIPDIQEIKTKFDFKQPDYHDSFEFITKDGQRIKSNVFLTSPRGAIQPKNMGARSFISTYFLNESLQAEFNFFLDDTIKKFYLYLLSLSDNLVYEYNNFTLKDLRRLVTRSNPFSNSHKKNQKLREDFLHELREKAFSLLINSYNHDKLNFIHAFKSLLLIDSINFITCVDKKGSVTSVKKIVTTLPSILDDFIINKIGSNSISISSETETLIIRFKFEGASNTSSIKLTSMYGKQVKQNEFLVLNEQTVTNVEKLIQNHKPTEESNTSNAIGKCNEALFCYAMICENRYLSRIDSKHDEVMEMLEAYSPLVAAEDLRLIKETNFKTTVFCKIKVQ